VKIAASALREIGLSRRISDAPNITVTPDRFYQALDVDLRLPSEEIQRSPNIPGYAHYGLKAAHDQIRLCAELGVAGVVVRVLDDMVPDVDVWHEHGQRWLTAMSSLSNFAKNHNVALVVDPFTAALQKNGQWGLFASEDPTETTSTLLHEIALCVRAAGCHGIMTLGRVQKEVEITKAAVQNTVRIYSFSTNTETTAAYAGNPSHAITNQKIWPGNSDEMLVWAIVDFVAGARTLVTKPIENFHITAATAELLTSENALQNFFTSDAVNQICSRSEMLTRYQAEIIQDATSLVDEAKTVKYGAYTVSGTTRLLGLLAQEDGTDAARARQEELWTNALSTADQDRMVIIDRGVISYFTGGILH